MGGEGEQKRKEGGGERAEEVRRAGGRWGGHAKRKQGGRDREGSRNGGEEGHK